MFLSYSRAGGLAYAQRLRDLLTNEHSGMSIFSDWTSSTIGSDLPPKLVRALDRARRMVLIVTATTARSQFVLREVQRFALTPRHVTVIVAAGVERPSWPELSGANWVTEDAEAFAEDDPRPSRRVLDRIAEAIDADTQERRTRRAAASAVATMLAAAIASAMLIVAARNARQERASAVHARDAAIAATKKQQRLAADAEARSKNANRQRLQAEEAKRVADGEARRQHEIAEATSLANRAETLLRQERHHLQQATLLAAVAVRRFHELGMRSATADLALRDALARTAHVERRIRFTMRGMRRISPDGRFLAIFDGRHIELIDVDRNKHHVLELTREPVSDLIDAEFSEDGSRLIAAAASENAGKSWLGLWRTDDGKPAAPTRVWNAPVTAIAITSQGSHYATWIGATVQVWDSATHAPASVELEHELPVSFVYFGRMRFSHSLRYLVAAGSPINRVWDWRSASTTDDPKITMTGSKFAFSGDDEILLVQGGDGVGAVSLRDRRTLWASEKRWGRSSDFEIGDLDTSGGMVAFIRGDTVEIRRARNEDLIEVISVPQPKRIVLRGDHVAVSSADGTVRLYQLSPKRELARVAHPPGGVTMALRPKGEMVTASASGALLWKPHPHGGDAVWSSDEDPYAIVVAADTGRFVTSGYATTEEREMATFLRVHDIATGRVLHETQAPGMAFALAYGTGGIVVAGTQEGIVYVWKHDVGGAPEPLQPAFEGKVETVAISPSSRYVAASTGSSLYVWDLGVRSARPVAIDNRSTVMSLLFTTDDELLASGSDGRLRWWQWRGTPRVRRQARTPGSWSLALGSDGKVASVDRTRVIVFDRDAHVVERIEHGAEIGRITSSASGILLSAGMDGLIRFWQLGDGTPAREITRVRGEITGEAPQFFAVSADGRYLLRKGDQNLRMELLEPLDLVQFACRRLGATASDNPAFAQACRSR